MGLPQRIAAKSVSAEKLKMSEDSRGTHSRHLKIVGGQDMSSFSTGSFSTKRLDAEDI